MWQTVVTNGFQIGFIDSCYYMREEIDWVYYDFGKWTLVYKENVSTGTVEIYQDKIILLTKHCEECNSMMHINK